MKNKVIVSVLIVIQLSCGSLYQISESKSDQHTAYENGLYLPDGCYMEIGFFPGEFETNNEITDSDLYACMIDSSRFIEDTVYMKEKEFTTLQHLLNRAINKDIKCSNLRLLMKTNKHTFALGNYLYSKNGKSSRKDCRTLDSLSYIVKKNCGYYNYIPKEKLVYHPEVKRFGIPENYHPKDFLTKDIIVTQKISDKIDEIILNDTIFVSDKFVKVIMRPYDAK